MLCQLCQVNEADLILKHVVDGEVSDLRVCEACASSQGLVGAGVSLGDILLGQGARAVSSPQPSSCPMCGLDFDTLRREGRVGCEQCYEVFSSYLLSLVATLQPGVQHVGSAPVRLQQHETLSELREELSEAVSLQAFERAAELRDRIRELEAGLLGGGE